MSPKTFCLDCGMPTASSRCPSCFQAKQQSNPRFKAKTAARGYDSKWQRVRIVVLNRDGWRCHYCNKYLEGKDATVDHINPLALGGDRLNLSNLVASCRSCNSSKKDKLI